MVQERKSVANAGLRVRRLTGDDIKPAHWEAFYQGYINTTGTPACPSWAVCSFASSDQSAVQGHHLLYTVGSREIGGS